jgi:hypothetical protein
VNVNDPTASTGRTVVCGVPVPARVVNSYWSPAVLRRTVQESAEAVPVNVMCGLASANTCALESARA